MGIRIQKYIGYYLSKENISKILKKDYDEIFESSKDVDINVIQNLYNKMKEKNYISYNVELAMLKRNKEKINSRDIIQLIFNGDNIEGLLFTTPSLKMKCRNDDLIDYYENVINPIYNVNYLKKAIYPEDLYVCIKEANFTKDSLDYYMEYQNPNKKKYGIQIGDVINYNELYILSLETDNKETDLVYPQTKKYKYFHPYINPIIYFVCLETGILKNNIDYIDFIKMLEPAIITTWS